MKTLEGKVALVAGSARGAGRGIACMLGEAGATVYCTARSASALDESAAMVTARGGAGIPVRVDHTKPDEVERLFERIRREQGRLDVLVNNINGDALHMWKSFSKIPPSIGLEILAAAIHAHLVNIHFAVPLMTRGLIVEITDGDGFYYRGNIYYDLSKVSAIRMAMIFATELRRKKIAAVAITPGFLRSEAVLESLKVTEENWRDAIRRRPEFAESETPCFVGRAIAALAADPNVMKKSGRVFNSLELAKEYGFTDVDGRTPRIWEWLSNSKFKYKKIDDAFYSYFDLNYDFLESEVRKLRKEISPSSSKSRS